jgi:hypothetical protein
MPVDDARRHGRGRRGSADGSAAAFESAHNHRINRLGLFTPRRAVRLYQQSGFPPAIAAGIATMPIAGSSANSTCRGGWTGIVTAHPGVT